MTTPTFRCSELDRVLSCPGSASLVPLVRPRAGQEGDEGTAIHWIAHTQLRDKHGASGDPGPTPAMPKSLPFSVWIGDYYVRHVVETVPPQWSMEVEAGLAYEWPAFSLSGHIDCVAISPDATEAIGFDLKTGYDPVDVAEMNEQCLGYSCLLLRAYPTLRKITFWIVQPRNDEDEGFQRTSSVTLDGDVLAAAPASLEARINYALANSNELSTGLKQCKWCSAAPQCPAILKLLDEMKHTLTPAELAAIEYTPNDAKLANWIIATRTLNRPMEDADDMGTARLEAQGFLQATDGTLITLKEEAGGYSFPDPIGFYRATRAIITDDAKYAETVKPSVTKTIEAIAAIRDIPKTAKKGPSAKAVFEETLKPLCVQGTRKKKVFATP
jgi:hypothetical protein